MLKKRFLFLFMIAAIGLGLLWIEDYTAQTIQDPGENISRAPDYYGNGLSSRRFSKDGHLERKVQADRSVHYPHLQQTELYGLSVESADQNGAFWQLTSDDGTHFEKNDQLLLKHNVRIVPVAPSASQMTEMTTSELMIMNQTGMAETKQPVQVKHSRGVMTATGMKIDFHQQRIQFLSEVNARYAP